LRRITLQTRHRADDRDVRVLGGRSNSGERQPLAVAFFETGRHVATPGVRTTRPTRDRPRELHVRIPILTRPSCAASTFTSAGSYSPVCTPLTSRPSPVVLTSLGGGCAEDHGRRRRRPRRPSFRQKVNPCRLAAVAGSPWRHPFWQRFNASDMRSWPLLVRQQPPHILDHRRTTTTGCVVISRKSNRPQRFAPLVQPALSILRHGRVVNQTSEESSFKVGV